MPLYVEQITTGRVYVATDMLLNRADMRVLDRAPVAPAAEPERDTPPTTEPETDAVRRERERLANLPPDPATPQPLVKPIRDMNKVELETYAKDRFGVDLGRRRKVGALRAEVQALLDAELGNA